MTRPDQIVDLDSRLNALARALGRVSLSLEEALSETRLLRDTFIFMGDDTFDAVCRQMQRRAEADRKIFR